MSFYDPWDNEITVKIDLNKIDESHGFEVKCYHEWVLYTGLSLQFEYCKACDIKKTNKNINDFCKK